MITKMTAAGFVVGLVLTMLLAIGPTSAEAAESIKIGIIDLQKALNESKKGAAARDQLKSKFEKLQNNLKAQEAGIEKMKQELEQQASMLSPEAKFEKETALKRKLRDFQDQLNDYNQMLRQEEMEITQPIVQGLLDEANKLGKEQGFTLIIERQKAGVIYYPEAMDITNEVIKRFDASSK